MGPEGGDKGGEIVVAGTPEDVAACESSWTGHYLKPCLEQASANIEHSETLRPFKT